MTTQTPAISLPLQTIAYIGLGANLGDAVATLKAATQAMAKIPLTQFLVVSSFYRSAPIDADGDDYVNAVAQIQTQLTPEQLLTALQNIEQHFGRTRAYQNAPRTLDCDLLLYGQINIDQPRLQIPHPRMHQRAFVLLPLLEITPALTIPNLGAAQSFVADVATQKIEKITSL